MNFARWQSLDGFNSAPSDEVESVLFGCCSSREWAHALASQRPYASLEALYEAADAALDDLDGAEFDAALAGHPRIGERAGDAHSADSEREQAGVSESSAATLAALAAGNREYEARFGHVYLVCADGRSGEELLAVLRERLGNDPQAEWDTTRAELRKINRLRLGRLIWVEAGA